MSNLDKTTDLKTVRILASISAHAHVVEVQGAWALVHASPMGLYALGKLNLDVRPTKRGGEYYAVRVGAQPLALVQPNVQPQEPRLNAQVRMEIMGQTYLVRETSPKRRIDVRRWEVRKVEGNSLGEMYVTTFQARDGSRTACSCKGGIYRKHCKHMTAIREQFGSHT